MSEINNVVVVSDTHSGCRLALCPPEIVLDDGGTYHHSPLQAKIWGMWQEFWGDFVPSATKHEPFVIVLNGDGLDGQPHQSKTPISLNVADQMNICEACLRPYIQGAEALYWIRGTEAHVGKSAENEELIAKRLDAKPNTQGMYARYDLWKKVDDRLVHILHHIGTTTSQAYESTALHKELTESYIEAARWGHQPPAVIVRSHRHRHFETKISTSLGHAIAVVTPGWQGKTPFMWRIAGARLSTPQFGGIVVRVAHDEMFVREKVWTVEHSEAE